MDTTPLTNGFRLAVEELASQVSRAVTGVSRKDHGHASKPLDESCDAIRQGSAPAARLFPESPNLDLAILLKQHRRVLFVRPPQCWHQRERFLREPRHLL